MKQFKVPCPVCTQEFTAAVDAEGEPTLEYSKPVADHFLSHNREEWMLACVRLFTEKVTLKQHLKMGRAVVSDFLPNVAVCALQDYKRLNDFMLATKEFEQ